MYARAGAAPSFADVAAHACAALIVFLPLNDVLPTM
jgi:hypothetical protein